MTTKLKKVFSLLAISTILSASYSTYSYAADDLETEEEVKKEERTTKMGGRNITAYSRKGSGAGVSIGGYFDSEYFFPDGKASYFDQHRLITQISSLYNDRIFFNAEIEYEHGGTINRDANDGQLKIEQAFLDYKVEDWLVFRGGGILIPVGRLNVLHDSDYRDTTARPLFNSTIVPSTWTETGLGFYGTSYPNDDIELNYEIYVTHGLNDKLEDGKGLKPAAPSLYKDNNNNKAVSTRVGVSPFIGLDLGLGGYYSTLDDKDSKSLGMAVADFDWKIGGFELMGEGGFVGFNPVDVKDKEGKVTGSLNGPMWGYYLEAKYHFFPEFLKMSFLGRDFNNPRFTVFSRIDQVDTDMSKLNVNDRTQLCFGFNYRPITNAVFKFEYQVNLENEAFVTKDFSKEKPNNQFIASIAAGF